MKLPNSRAFTALALLSVAAALTFVVQPKAESSALVGVAEAQQSPESSQPLSLAVENGLVGADPTCQTLPAGLGAMYLFTTRAMTRFERAQLHAQGFRYLGAAGQHVYAMQLTRAPNAERTATLKSQAFVAGTAVLGPTERLSREVYEFLNQESGEPKFPVAVEFWSSTTKSEIESALGFVPEDMSLPQHAFMPILTDRFTYLPLTRSEVEALSLSPFVARLDFQRPYKSLNVTAQRQSDCDVIQNSPFNLTGDGIVIGQWDGGSVDNSHPDFGGRVFNQDAAAVSDHSTHVAGTIVGSGQTRSAARGFAPNAELRAYTFAGSVPLERRRALHDFAHWVDNHSWGTDSTTYGGYNSTAREFDTDARDLLLLGVKAAGNEGQDSEIIVNNYGFDSLTPDSTLKNNLVIGASEDNRSLASFSSRGPTNDGRIKPDIVMNGVTLLSTQPGGNHGNSSGTSMAAPAATGLIAQLSQGYRELYNGRRWAPDLVRTLLIHTAVDEFHPGPDYRFGWGIADGKAALDLMIADAAGGGRQLVRGAVRDTQSEAYTITVSAGQPELKITMSWLDAFTGGTASRRLIHDLDLIVTDPLGTQHFPWTLDPDNPFEDAVKTQANTIDNVEQVLVENPMAGDWTVRVLGRSITDVDLPVQGYVIASSHELSGVAESKQIAVGNGIAIPDGSQSGLTLDFDMTSTGLVHSLRLFLNIQHDRRGDLRVELTHPDSTTITLESADTSSRDDIYAVYPDLRSYDDDTTVFHGKNVAGTWKLRVIDTLAANTGTIQMAALEIDVDDIPNRAPIADAGADQAVVAGDLVTLDATGSSDPDNDTLNFQWQQISGPTVSLSTGGQPQRTFTAPSVSASTDLTFEVTVGDGQGEFDTDQVTIRVEPLVANPPDIATISTDEVSAGERLVLTGTGLSNATVTIEGVTQILVSVTSTRIEILISSETPVTDDATLVVETAFGSDQTLLAIAEPDPILPTSSPSGGGGCGFVIGSPNSSRLVFMFLIAFVIVMGRSMQSRASRR